MQIVVDGVLTHYLDLNPKAKKTLVILHGWGHNAALWQPVIEKLPPDYRYLLLDLPGFGQTDYLTAAAGVPEYTQFVLAFLAKLKLKKPALLGHSFGGQIGMYLAAKFPDSISHLLLLSPAGIRTKTPKQKTKTLIYKKFRYFKAVLPTFILKRVIRLFTSTDYLNATPQHKAVLNQIVNQDLSDLLGEIKVPTEIIWGDLDTEIPYEGKHLAEKIPDSRLWVLYGADHNPHLKKGEQLAEVISKTLH